MRWGSVTASIGARIELSGGTTATRRHCAGAAVHRPKIVLADEPTAALDRQRQRPARSSIVLQGDGLAAGLQHPARHARPAWIVDVADRILTLEDGRLTMPAPGA